mgnify:CR=1 FL=1
MIQIKFRGIPKDKELWSSREDRFIYGYYAELGVGNRKKYYIIQNCSEYPLFKNPEDDECFMDVEVDPNTVGRFTGLNDKNGNEIYEGDIVEAWSEGVKAIGEVKRRMDGLFIIYPAYQRGEFWGLCPDVYGHTTVEIIGNVYENPELLGR